MKEKNIKFILELIFIFILPLCLLATCFKQEKVYDENNNEVGKYLTFDNIFLLSEEQVTYYNYEYYDLNEEVIVSNEPIYVNYNKSPFLYNSNNNYKYIFINYNNSYYYIPFLNSPLEAQVISTDIQTIFNDDSVVVIRPNDILVLSNQFGNIIKNINTYTIGDNVVNRLLNLLYDTLGITSNWILQFIVIYTLLWLVMWFIWHILYLPLDFICSKLLFDRVDK